MKSAAAFHRIIVCSIAPFTLCAVLPSLHADVVLEWNATIADFAQSQTAPGLPWFEEARAYAMAHLVMADLLSAATDRSAAEATDADTAMAQAAHDVLIAILPDARDLVDARLASQLALCPAGSAQARGVALGSARARAFLSERAYDLGQIHGRDWAPARLASLFILRSKEKFRAPVPDAPSMVAERMHFDRTRELKLLLDRNQIDARTEVVRLWTENPAAIWNRAARDLAIRQGLPSRENVRLFALLNAALADACILAADSRAYYVSVREETRLVADGNPEGIVVSGDSIRILPTRATVRQPILPDYPSVPATMSGAAARVLADFFGADNQPFTLNGPTRSDALTSWPGRTYERFSAAAKECAIAGLCSGTDYREACIAGYLQGSNIGKAVGKNRRFAKPR